MYNVHNICVLQTYHNTIIDVFMSRQYEIGLVVSLDI